MSQTLTIAKVSAHLPQAPSSVGLGCIGSRGREEPILHPRTFGMKISEEKSGEKDLHLLIPAEWPDAHRTNAST